MNPSDRRIASGGSAIIGPLGNYVAGPVYEEETIVYGEIDLAQVAVVKRALDVAGHYSRPDVVRLLFDQSPHSPLVTADGAAEELERPSDRRPSTRRATKRARRK